MDHAVEARPIDIGGIPDGGIDDAAVAQHVGHQTIIDGLSHN
jgi:hypothetical protein